jgi:hypothetical protein
MSLARYTFYRASVVIAHENWRFAVWLSMVVEVFRSVEKRHRSELMSFGRTQAWRENVGPFSSGPILTYPGREPLK